LKRKKDILSPENSTKDENNSTQNEWKNKNVVIDESCKIGENVNIGNLTNLKSDAIIGDNTIIGQNVVVAEGVVIGKNCEIQNNICFHSGVKCEDDVFIGHAVVFTNVYFPHQHITVNQKRAEMITHIQQGVKIGANVTIVCGVVIGKYAFISAGSVISNDVKPYALITGNPSKQTGWMSEHGSKMNFLNRTRTAICPISGHNYKLDHNGVRRIS
jgi:UDP-2-acetamido-3-amino-2,3-dideoxy-glucuronate N-acetyltransferase